MGSPRGRARVDLEHLLHQAAARGRSLAVWWRDDDAVAPTPMLDRLLELRGRHGIPLGLAVIPAGADEALKVRLAAEREVWVLQHGWRHAQHNRPGEKKSELGDQRPLPAVLEELRAGREKLERMLPRHFLPVLVPPWNRVSDTVRAARREIGLPGLSAFGPAGIGDPHQVNTQVDALVWKPARRPLSRDELFRAMCGEVERRLAGADEPIGILTHHLVHEEESWEGLEDLFGMLSGHPAVRWPALPELFGIQSELQ